MKASSIILACAIVLTIAGAQAQDASSVAADGGFQALVGATIVGRDGEGQPALTYFNENGDVTRVDGDTKAVGAWTLRGEKVCFEFADADDETCYRVGVQGDMATFTAQDGASRAYQVLQGDATGASR